MSEAVRASAAPAPQRRRARPTLRKRARMAAHAIGLRSLLKQGAGRLGFDMVNRHFYSPIPDVAALPDRFWERRSALGGLAWDPDAQLAFVREHLAAYVEEFTPPRDAPRPGSLFYLDNGTYGPVDAELLYAMIRWSRPARVVEVGSGFSSLVIGEALAANRARGAAGALEIIDPWPASASFDMGGEDALRRVGALRLESVLHVPLDEFRSLRSGDILFVDTTHTVKVGGDVNRIVLDILPVLAPGVIVHFHDVFLPREYPRDWVERQEWYWAEQYLLQAFLAYNDAWEVLVATHHLAVDRAAELTPLVPSAAGARPLALWIRRSG